ncbi:histidinol-phosphate transaminase [bacterium]|nr:histidinol-phosphate transaminase [bacterium]
MAPKEKKAQQKLMRPSVRKLHAYTPGEQPKVRGLIKLNTNENPAPPSPKVLKALSKAVDIRLRLYPDPSASELRQLLASLYKLNADQVIVGNGSDDLLALATRAFVEPQHPTDNGTGINRSTIQYFVPSYSLYPVLTDIQNARRNEVPLLSNFNIPAGTALKKAGWKSRAALSLVTTPNAPSGRGYSNEQLRLICEQTKGVVILDEAYAEFANENALSLIDEFPNVLISRTFSKAYSLCFQRVGYFLGNPELIEALDKVRDSYNVNGLGQTAAIATLKDHAYYRRNFKAIIQRRKDTTEAMEEMGFDVLPSQTNFVFAKPPAASAETWFDALRENKVVVRWFKTPEISQYLRVTMGSESEMKTFLKTCKAILKTLS